MHALTEAKWGTLSDEEKAHYEWLAELSKEIAKTNKKAADAKKSRAVGDEAGPGGGEATYAPRPNLMVENGSAVHP